MAELSPIFQSTFEYTVDNEDLNTNIKTNGGAITQANAMAVVGSSTTTDSTACLQSHQPAKYRAGLGGLIRFNTLFTAGVADTEQLIGLADETGSSVAFKNGFMIGYIGTVFGVHRFSNDTITTVALASWDDGLVIGDASKQVLDTTKLNAWMIQFKGGGAIRIWHEVSETGEMSLVHTIPYSNLFTEPPVYNSNFKFMLWVNNKTTTTDVVVKCSFFAYFTEGKTRRIMLHQPVHSTGEKEKTSVTTEVAIVTIRNKATYASKTNFIDIVLLAMSGSIEASSANNLGKVRLVKNATLGGTPSYSDINTSDSVVEVDTAGTTVTGGEELNSAPLAGKNDRVFMDIASWQISLDPGETLTLAGSSANSATIDGALVWQESF